jgi:hypothetical protein
MAVGRIGWAPLKSGDDRCTTAAPAAEMTKHATESAVFLLPGVVALCNMTRKYL